MTENTKTGDRLLDLLYQELTDLSVRMSQVKDMIATRQDGRPPNARVIFPYFGMDAGEAAIEFLKEAENPQTFDQINQGLAKGGFQFAARQPGLQVPNALRAMLRFGSDPKIWIVDELVGLIEWPKPSKE